jgi:peptidyl-prolyl cis-trans isomerase A (cyclophilin A)
VSAIRGFAAQGLVVAVSRLAGQDAAMTLTRCIASSIGLLGLLACAPAPVADPPPAPTVATDPPARLEVSHAPPSSEGEAARALDEERGEDDCAGGCPGELDAPVHDAPAIASVPSEPPLVAKGPFRPSSHPAMKRPALAQGKAPRQFSVRFDTTAGEVTVHCERDWGPHGADRFYSLVAIGYFDDVAFFRAIRGFMVQFGIHGDPEVNKVWKEAYIAPDVVKASNLQGTLSVAHAGRPVDAGKTGEKRSTQFFINLVDNDRLDAMGFAPICRVTQGFDVVESLYADYGERASLEQPKINAEGNAYLRDTYPGLDYIKTARIVP